MKANRADVQATEAYEAERKKVEDARAALPDVETLLSLDELQVGLFSLPFLELNWSDMRKELMSRKQQNQS
jgi:hypothetical protein